jgi:hypothetical protein
MLNIILFGANAVISSAARGLILKQVIIVVFAEVPNKLDCVSLVGLSSLVYYLRVRPRAYPRGHVLHSGRLQA